MIKTRIRKDLFGGKIDFIIYDAPKEIVEDIVDEVYLEGLRLQKIFNLYDADSELSLLNRLREYTPSDELMQLLRKGLSFSRLTDGNYDISLGRYILLRKEGKIEPPKVSYKDISIRDNKVILKKQDVMIDLGSAAKGYITDMMGDLLHKKGIDEFMIDARGDICVRGKDTHIIGIRHPRKKESICSIRLKDQAAATSGDYMQYVKDPDTGDNISHIINQKDIRSVTVVAPSVEDADIYATAIFTSDMGTIKKIARLNKDIRFMIIKEEEIIPFNNFEGLICKA